MSDEAADMVLDGIRGLAGGWAAWHEYDAAIDAWIDAGQGSIVPRPNQPHCSRLSAYELGALLGWVAREMEREVERRRVLREAKLLEGQGCGFIARGELESVARLLSSKGLLRPCWLGTWEDGEESELGFVLTRTGAARVVDIDPHDTDTDNDREAIAHHIGETLGGVFAEERGPPANPLAYEIEAALSVLPKEQSLAWQLCEAAGWPS